MIALVKLLAELGLAVPDAMLVWPPSIPLSACSATIWG